MTGKFHRLLHALTHPLVGAIGFGLLIWMLLPRVVVVIDDDFGYLRSVVETCQRGRPWTYEWLTPWAASMSILAATLFKITGRFSFAIHFSLALAASLGFLGLTRYLACNGISRGKACLIAFLLLGSPTVLFMLVMFTSVALYLGCLWMCVHFARQKRWSWFYLFWLIGLAARQSAVVWLALPGWAVVFELWRTKSWFPKDRVSWAPLAVIFGGGLALLVMKLGMNPTYGQAIVAASTKGLHLKSNALAWSLLALVAGYGWSCFASLFCNAESRYAALVDLRSRQRLIALVPFCTLGFLGAHWFHTKITATHSAYSDPFAAYWFGLVGITAALGIVLNPIKPRWEMLIAGLGATALLSLYGGTFDYYYIDPFFWGFASAVVAVNGTEAMPPSKSAAGAGWVLASIMGLCLVWNLRCYVRQKYELDRVAALNQVYEQAVRSGTIKPHEIGLSPFGYVGWRFEHYFHTHEGKDSPDLGGFINCIDGWNGKQGMAVEVELPKPFNRDRGWIPTHNNALLGKSREAETITKLRTRILWSYKATYLLKRMPGAMPRDGKIAIDYSDYEDRPFPLNDAEWRMLIENGRVKYKHP